MENLNPGRNRRGRRAAMDDGEALPALSESSKCPSSRRPESAVNADAAGLAHVMGNSDLVLLDGTVRRRRAWIVEQMGK